MRRTPKNRDATPSLLDFFLIWRIDPIALAALVVVGTLYGLGVATLARRGEAWPVIRTLGFYAAGLGSFAVISFGFLGAYSTELRWAFTTRIALLLFAVPALIGIGQPITLARRALSETPLRITNAVLASWPVRLIGNAIFAPLFALAAFCVFLTPLAGSLRESAVAENVLTLAVPLVGLLMVLPIIEHTTQRTSFFITAEFMLVFVELIIDAIPAILMRLNDGVLDQLAPYAGLVPAWFPSALQDQHLAGDFLWFIAEVADIPILILLFIRWSKIDRKEAKQLDELSDEEMDRLTREHLRARPE